MVPLGLDTVVTPCGAVDGWTASVPAAPVVWSAAGTWVRYAAPVVRACAVAPLWDTGQACCSAVTAASAMTAIAPTGSVTVTAVVSA